MIKITIPSNNLKERQYIIDILLNEFLGLEFQLVYGNSSTEFKHWSLELENGNKIIFEDHFFSEYPKDLEYLDLNHIPKSIHYIKNDFISEEDLPVIFGNSLFNISENNDARVFTCGVDIFASSFFMLSRWEEYVNKNRDTHGRFLASDSLAFNHGFLDRPIVNEYVILLRNLLLELGHVQKFKSRKYQMLLTHDVDHILKWDSLIKFSKHLIGDLVIRRSIKEFFASISYFIKVRLKLKNDPYETFDDLMTLSESAGVKSYFFFMGKGKTSFDNNYRSDSKVVFNLIKNIKKRNHFIGIHPTYDAYDSFKQFEAEKSELEQSLLTNIHFGREHYLRFEVPDTWQIWDDNNMTWDSTMGYADKEGFRCGVCFEYSVFNILTRQHLELKERPLIVMDVCVIDKGNLSPEKASKNILNLIVKIKKYEGDFVLLWHNSSFNTFLWDKYQNVYLDAVYAGTEDKG